MLLQLFPLWAVLLSLLAYFVPGAFTSMSGAIIPLLTVIMLAMGLTLTTRDFANVAKSRKAMAVGVVLQFLIMPAAAWTVATLFGFGPELMIGTLLVGSVAGGTSSNVMCYLAKGDTALSISMTAASTIIGVFLTPVLASFFAGQSIDVPVQPMLMTLLQVVLVPVAIGVALNEFASKWICKIEGLFPYVSMFAILLIIAIVVALNAGKIATVGLIVAFAVILHNAIGLALGYGITALLGFDRKICRTIAFEVGLQNSGLATALALKFFTPTAALPGTLFSVWHNISGSLLAGYWSRKPIADDAK
ncbi:bile acid:sodium symporter family protein [Thalassospira xiamenensis]|uniref:Bile acid:sodium symporter n=1 Tax=Thalassospira xiamenensis TaxID=220697 RepID=A0A367XD11_9PROT|nr:bile acid:sodium symporter family protein [Thalassospira xiamenensis]KZB54721.1 bile acid:sodium symporter [Thalassospira xiamenensis]MCK2168961.1 bile acid:sodium symporter family protein [Thalassospira xiamenensis]RCK51030.1 bile acid:sodium symporter [Thalassospira xiamenensis]